MTSQFTGFPKDAIRFLNDLADNNEREWFQANKKRYEAALKNPAKAFCDAMSEELETLTSRTHKAKVFRINRDLRFSKDKTPYNCHLHIAFTPEDSGSNPPGWMFALETDQVILGTGIFAFDKTQLTNWRQSIAEDGEAWGSLITAAGRSNEPELKKVPPGFDREHPQEKLLRHKGLAVWRDFDNPAVACSGNLIQLCLENFGEMQAIHDRLLAL